MQQTQDADPERVLAPLTVRVLVVIGALATPLLTAWLGVRVLAGHLESLQPDGDLEAGGNFALAVLGVVLVLLNYVGSGLVLLGAWRWVGRSLLGPLLTVAGSSLVITLTTVALDWQ